VSTEAASSGLWGLALVIVFVAPASAGEDDSGTRTAWVPAACDPLGAEAELAAIEGLLRAKASDLEWPDWQGGIADLSTRLALFEPRFGLRAEECDGWITLREAASVLVSQFHEFTADTPDVLSLGWGHGPCALRWDLATLLELTGGVDGARELLFTPLDDIPSDHWTGDFYVEDDLADLGRMRSEFLVRRGESRAALGELMSGLLARGGCGSAWPERLDSAAWLYALVGQIDVAALLRERAARARREPFLMDLPLTEAVGWSRESAENRVLLTQVRLEWQPVGPWNRAVGACVIGRNGEPDSWHLLAVRIPTSNENRSDAIRTEWQVDQLQGTRRWLESLLQADDMTVRWSGLLCLHALDHRGRQRLPELLSEYSKEPRRKDGGWTMDHADFAARQSCGGGPSFERSLSAMSPSDFSRAWLAWLEDHPP